MCTITHGVSGVAFRLPTKWTRTYPIHMELSADDQLAVVSGAWERYEKLDIMRQELEEFGTDLKVYLEECPSEEKGFWYSALTWARAFWKYIGELMIKKVGNSWVEPLGSVSFEELDVQYLDYLIEKRLYYNFPERLWDDQEAMKQAIWPFYTNQFTGKKVVNPLFYALDEYRITCGDRWTGNATAKKGGQGKIESREQFDSQENYLTRKLQKSGLEELDGFDGGDGWVDRGLFQGRTTLHAEYFDYHIEDPKPFSIITRTVQMGSEKIQAESSVELVKMIDALTTHKMLRKAGIPEQKLVFEVNGKIKKSLQMVQMGKTYIFPPRYIPLIGEMYTNQDGTEQMVFHDRWLWAAIESAQLKLDAMLVGIRAAGDAGLYEMYPDITGLKKGEAYSRVKKELAKIWIPIMQGCFVAQMNKDSHPYYKMLCWWNEEIQKKARQVRKELHEAITKKVELVEMPDEFIDLEILAKLLRLRGLEWKKTRLKMKDIKKRENAKKIHRLTHQVWVERINDDVAICEVEK